MLTGAVPAGPRVAVVGAGGIGFDVAEFLVQGRPSPTEDLSHWLKDWGVTDPANQPGGLVGAAPEAPARQVTLMQRKAEKPGRSLGKTTGWIHRATLAAKGVRMIGGLNYERITPAGILVSYGERRENPELIAADTIVLCAGQLSNRALADHLFALGRPVHVVGGADIAAELDAKRAIDGAMRLALTL